MENPPDPSGWTPIGALVDSFVEYTASSREEALFFLHSYNFHFDDALLAYFTNISTLPVPNTYPSTIQDQESNADPLSPLQSQQPYSPSPASPAAHAPQQMGQPQGSKNMVENEDSGSGPGGIGRVTDLNKNVSVDTSGLDFGKQLRLNRIFKGKGWKPWELPHETVSHTLTFWRNGFTVDDGPLRRIEDPANAPFLQSLANPEPQLPEELDPGDKDITVDLKIVRRDEDYSEPKRHPPAIPETGRTSGINEAAVISTSPESSDASTPYMVLVVDDSLPTTSIQIRLADGTRIVSRFNYSHTIRDIRAFIDHSGSSGARDYQLQAMGFPPKQLTDVNQTIEQAGIANSVVIQKL
ncbi:hypothetical protein MLD38_003034 [Melastoma candidum]|uniref:Uncharacterized protein n=1 Tax=Melastoma candidum TaxID=119954 RepID=A0ACB9S4E4_9MYRT|nr:hypothetical protein MLD38_003034 [Melastoma candidum]